MNCKCGHSIEEHDSKKGCLHYDPITHYFNCNCNNGPSDVVATLLAAGDAMAKRLRSLRVFANEVDMRGKNTEGYINASTLFTPEDAAALAAWEQVKR